MSSETSWRIEALLDKPIPDSMGMHGLLISDPGRNHYEICGINGPRFERQSLQEHELIHLIGTDAMRSSIVLELEDVNAPDYMLDIPHVRWAGLYVGEAFRIKAESHELDVRPLRAHEEYINVPGGTLELDATDVVFNHIDSWLARALKQVVKHSDKEVATLMTRCDSTNIKSQIAHWLAAPNEESRNQELNWVLRLSRDNNWDLVSNAEDLVKLYQETLAAL